MVTDHNKEEPGESTVVEDPVIEDDTPILDRGAVVGRYLVADRIGRGGMSEVYKAFDPDLNRPVALKLLTVKKNKQDDTGEQSLNRMAIYCLGGALMLFQCGAVVFELAPD